MLVDEGEGWEDDGAIAARTPLAWIEQDFDPDIVEGTKAVLSPELMETVLN